MTDVQEITITVDEIRTAWQAIQDGVNPMPNQTSLSDYISRRWRGDIVDTFVGASGTQINDWINNGFYPEGEGAELDFGNAEIQVPQLTFDEEDGNLSIDMALSGEDMPFIRWENMPAKRGMTIKACFDTNCNTPAEALAQYFEWILKAIDAAEARGIAPDVELFINTVGSFHGHPGRYRLCIPVVKAGELIDVVAWRAFLSGGGFRSLGFLAIGLAAEKLNDTVTYGLGSAVGTKFEARRDGDTLYLECPSDFRRFPEDEMTAKLDKALAQ